MAKERSEPKTRTKGEGFWSFTKVMFLVLFIAGFVLGMLAMGQISPLFEGAQNSDCSNLQAVNSTLDKQLDTCTSCLNTHGISPEKCRSS